MRNADIDVDALVFDVFGTLFDHDSAVRDVGSIAGTDASVIADLWRRKQLEYSWLRTLMQRPADFREVTREALDYALATLGLPADKAATMMATYGHLDLFPEVRAALAELGVAGHRLAVLSNGSPAMLKAVLESSKISDPFEMLLSAADAGVFKPHPLVYRHACDRLGLAPGRIALVSSNAWDVAGAAAFGFKAIWINRAAAVAERLPAGPDLVLESLTDLPGRLSRAS